MRDVTVNGKIASGGNGFGFLTQALTGDNVVYQWSFKIVKSDFTFPRLCFGIASSPENLPSYTILEPLLEGDDKRKIIQNYKISFKV